MNIDPITFAVIKNAMDSIVDEIAYTVVRTARSATRSSTTTSGSSASSADYDTWRRWGRT